MSILDWGKLIGTLLLGFIVVYGITIGLLGLYVVFTNKEFPNEFNEQSLDKLVKDRLLLKDYRKHEFWVAAKPMRCSSLKLWKRFKLAKRVFFGKVDIIDWKYNDTYK